MISFKTLPQKTKHYILSKETERLRRKIIRTYELFGFKIDVKLDIIFLMVILCGCICNTPFTSLIGVRNETTTLQSSTTITLTPTTTNIINNAPVTTLRQIAEVITQIKYEYVNKTIDLTAVQRNRLLNMKVNCNTASCSDGAWRMKLQALEILNLPTPKFAEKESSGVMEILRSDNNSRICLEPEFDSFFNPILVFNTTYWKIISNSKETIKIRKR